VVRRGRLRASRPRRIPVDPISQLAFDLDDLPPVVEIERQLTDRVRAAAVAKLASLIARLHAATGYADERE